VKGLASAVAAESFFGTSASHDEERIPTMNQTRFSLSPADRAVAASAHHLASSIVRDCAPQVDSEARFPAESISALAKEGLLGLALPAESGGKALGMPAFVAVTEALAQECGSTAMVYVMHVAASRALAESPHFSRRKEVLRSISEGQHLLTLAFAEAGSRSQFWAPLSVLANEADGDYRVTARKAWVTSANWADSIVTASLGRPPGQSQPALTAYVVDRRAEGVRVGKNFEGLGLRGNDSVPVAFENLKVAADDLLTEPGASMDLIMGAILPWYCVGTAAMAHGLCEGALGLTSRHLTSRSFEHLGASLRDLPVLRARYAEMLTRTTASRSLLRVALERVHEEGPAAMLYLLQARLDALEAALLVTDLAMKACGGAAFSKHLPVERMFRDARAGWVMSPTADHLREFIGRLALGLPLFGN
jgi:alkylation response protein AidB-like acyl-CoA dehydrogenase